MAQRRSASFEDMLRYLPGEFAEGVVTKVTKRVSMIRWRMELLCVVMPWSVARECMLVLSERHTGLHDALHDKYNLAPELFEDKYKIDTADCLVPVLQQLLHDIDGVSADVPYEKLKNASKRWTTVRASFTESMQSSLYGKGGRSSGGGGGGTRSGACFNCGQEGH